MTRSIVALLLTLAASLALAESSQVVKIVAPTERYLIDEMDVRVEVNPPPGTQVESVEIRVDGKVIASLRNPPFQIRYDFGEQLAPHRLEAVAHLSNGTSPIERFDSAGADLNYNSQVVLISLNLAVQDRNGAYVMDLGREHFRVFENGRPQKIAYSRTRPNR